jgi:hypothetical protein
MIVLLGHILSPPEGAGTSQDLIAYRHEDSSREPGNTRNCLSTDCRTIVRCRAGAADPELSRRDSHDLAYEFHGRCLGEEVADQEAVGEEEVAV